MHEDIAGELRGQILDAADRRVRELAYEAAKRLKAYIQYEYTISNMELASSWKRHGYDFRMMPQEFIEHIEITPVARDGNRYSLEVRLPAESFKEQSTDKVDFFKKYALTNAMNKIKSIYGGGI